MDKRKNDELGVRRPSRALALLLIGVGVVMLLANVGLFSIADFGRFFGQMGASFGLFFGQMGAAFGRVFGTLGVLIGRFWPLILIGVGLLLVLRPSRRNRRAES
jgi:hypothetical protein